MPIIFSIMSLESLFSLPVNTLIICVYIISLLSGLSFGIIQAKLQKPIPNIDKKRLVIPGTWSIMIIILIIFISKYYFGYQAATNPLIIHSNAFIIISGVTTGLFIGKTIYYYWKCYRGPWVDLDKKRDKYPT
jgi:small-conductance mechanosensitive channel